MSCRFVGGRPKSAPTLRTEGGTKLFNLSAPAANGSRKHAPHLQQRVSSVRWADQDEEPLTTEEIEENGKRLALKATPVEAQLEAEGPPDPLLEHGTRLAETGCGRTPLFEA